MLRSQANPEGEITYLQVRESELLETTTIIDISLGRII